jgi:hypothetical protein
LPCGEIQPIMNPGLLERMVACLMWEVMGEWREVMSQLCMTTLYLPKV